MDESGGASSKLGEAMVFRPLLPPIALHHRLIPNFLPLLLVIHPFTQELSFLSKHEHVKQLKSLFLELLLQLFQLRLV